MIIKTRPVLRVHVPVSEDVNKVGLGDIVVCQINGGANVEYQIVRPEDSNPTEGRVSVNAPLGSAVLEAGTVGGKATYTLPGGSECEVVVVKIRKTDYER